MTIQPSKMMRGKPAPRVDLVSISNGWTFSMSLSLNWVHFPPNLEVPKRFGLPNPVKKRKWRTRQQFQSYRRHLPNFRRRWYPIKLMERCPSLPQIRKSVEILILKDSIANARKPSGAIMSSSVVDTP